VAAVALLGGGGDSGTKRTAGPASTPAAGSTAQPAKTPAASGASTARSDYTVAGLNGTTIAGLAKSVASRVADAGFKRGTTANYTDQARAASLVLYTSAPGARRAAFQVAKLLSTGSPPDVQPIDDSAKQLAPDAQVVVVVGADQSP
jgi:hypothetical protein